MTTPISQAAREAAKLGYTIRSFDGHSRNIQDAIDSELATLRGQLEEAQLQIIRDTECIERCRRAGGEAEVKLAETQQQLEIAEASRDVAKHAWAKSSAERDALASQLEEANRRLEIEKTAHRSTIDLGDKLIAATRAERDAALAHVSEVEKERDELKEDIAYKKLGLASLKAQVSRLEAEVERLKADGKAG